jgi:hypothetical protein
MERFDALPRVAILLALLAALAVGVFAPAPWSGLAFLVVSAFIGWLLYLTWPRLTLPERLMRFAVLALTVAVGIINLGLRA